MTRLQDQRERNEATRLLYVAATRARLQLHLFGQLEEAHTGETRSRAAQGHASGTAVACHQQRISAAGRASRGYGSAAVCGDPGRGHSGALARRLEPATAATGACGARAANRLIRNPRRQWLPRRSRRPSRPRAGWNARCAKILRDLARRRRVPVRDPAPLAQQLAERLQVLGVAPEALASSVAMGVELLAACLDDARLQWIFASLGAAPTAADVPLALTGMFAGRLHSVRADLSFKDQGGHSLAD